MERQLFRKLISAAWAFWALISFADVQLWENGPYWAECNVGATHPEDGGYYFRWGDTVGYRRVEGRWCAADGSDDLFYFSGYDGPTIAKGNAQLQAEGYLDASGNLAAAHDAATAYRGAPWRMPTKTELEDLKSNCTMTWETCNGVSGVRVTGTGAYASKSIFLPAAGEGDVSSLRYAGEECGYWSSTPYAGNSLRSWYLTASWYSLTETFVSFLSYGYTDTRDSGRSVRPVRTVQFVPPDTGSGARQEQGSHEDGRTMSATTNDVPVVEPTGTFSAPSAKKLQGAVFKDGKVFGSIQLKVGRASSKTGESKVSATVYGLDGKKYAAKAVKVPTGGTPEATLSVKSLGTLKVTLGENGFSGTLDGMTVTSVEATPATSTGKADFVAGDLTSVVSDALTNYFPKAEAVTRTERKWKVVDKPGKLKLVKERVRRDKDDEDLLPEDVDYDFKETGGNIAGLKLTYAWKTQTFKGSFKIWTFNEARLKLKSVKAKVTGVVVNGSGYGQVTVKKVKVGELTVR